MTTYDKAESLLDKLNASVADTTVQIEAFAITASFDFEKSVDNKVVIRRDNDTFAEIELSSILPYSVSLLTKDEVVHMSKAEATPYDGIAGELYRLKLLKGTKGILHYKSVSVPFVLDFEVQRSFYIDMEKENVVYLDEKKPKDPAGIEAESATSTLTNQCYKWVTLWDAGCCETSVKPNGRGLVACNNEWRDDRCCDGGS